MPPMIQPDLAPPSRFPLSLSTIEQSVQGFESLGSSQLKLIKNFNRQSTDRYSPLDHMLEFTEDPMVSSFMSDFAHGPGDREVIANGFWQGQAAACMGEIIMRTQETEMAKQGHQLPPVRLDPMRRYLIYPEVLEGDNAGRYAAERHIGGLAERYIDSAVNLGYFAEDAAQRAMHELENAWVANRSDALFTGESNDEAQGKGMFGEFCRSMFQLLRLYRIGEHEGRLAPWEQTAFDEQKHILLNEDPVTIINPLRFDRYSRRWLYDYKAEYAAGTSRKDFEDYIIPPGARIQSVQRFLTGLVESPADPSMLSRVIFRNSVETYELQQDDVLVVGQEDGIHRLLRYPFTSPAVSPEDVWDIDVLCRDGVGIPLCDQPYWDDQLYARIDEALTGSSPLYEYGIERDEEAS